MGIPKELAGVQARFARAVAQKQEWFQAYVSRLNLKPGAVLPYAEEMEVSREEYAALTAAYAHPAIVPLATIQIEVDCRGGTMHFRAAPPNDFLGQVQVDAKGALSGPRGLGSSPETVRSRHAKFGIWSGTTWFSESVDPARGNARHFELTAGKLDDSGRLFLLFDNSVIENKSPQVSNHLLAWLTKIDPTPAQAPRPAH